MSPFPLNGKAHLSVESHVASGASVEIIAVSIGRVNFSLTRVKECLSPPGLFWSRRYNTETFQKALDISQEPKVCVVHPNLPFLVDKAFRVSETPQKSCHTVLGVFYVSP